MPEKMKSITFKLPLTVYGRIKMASFLREETMTDILVTAIQAIELSQEEQVLFDAIYTGGKNAEHD